MIAWSGAHRENDRLWLTGTYDELDNLAGFVAAEANNGSARRRQRLLDEVAGQFAAALADA